MSEGLEGAAPSHIEAGLRGLVKSMVALAASDRIIRTREVEAIGTIFKDLTGQALDLTEVRRAAETFRDKKMSIRDMLVDIEGDMEPEFKETIVKACYLIGISDAILVQVELDDVYKIGKYLKLGPGDVDQLIVEMEKRIQEDSPYH